MIKRKRVILTFFIAIIFTYGIFAVIETINLSSKTVEEAFEKFLNSEFQDRVQQDIGNRAFYQFDDDALVPFEVGDQVSFAEFEKGIFGWKQVYYSQDNNEDYSYSMIESDESILFHGVIPADIIADTQTIWVNGINAEIIMLNSNTGVWVMPIDKITDNSDSQQDVTNIPVKFLDKKGNVIGEI